LDLWTSFGGVFLYQRKTRMMMTRTRMGKLCAEISVAVEEVEKLPLETATEGVRVGLVVLVMPTWIAFLP
jgi:hypothetical protein